MYRVITSEISLAVAAAIETKSLELNTTVLVIPSSKLKIRSSPSSRSYGPKLVVVVKARTAAAP